MADQELCFARVEGKTPRGAVPRWLDTVAIPFVADECLIFPFYKGPSGHGRLSGRKGPAFAHVYVAEKTIGPKPDDLHEVCHGCGNPSCVNPLHLRWGTRAENIADRKAHGVFQPPPTGKGEACSRAILTEPQVLEIRRRLSTGETMQSIADAFGVSMGAISGIKYRIRWAHLP
jgi:hypothetical protein